MIKDFKKCDAPDVELGNLTIENCSSVYVSKNPSFYPAVWYGEKKKDGAVLHYVFAHSPDEEAPKGATVEKRFDSPGEALLDYADWIKRDHADVSDERMLEMGKYPFGGFKRNSRWRDEMLRRKLIKE